MNNGIKKQNLQYKTGDVIFKPSSLGAPGPDWLNLSTSQTIYSNTSLGYLFNANNYFKNKTNLTALSGIADVSYQNNTITFLTASATLVFSTNDGGSFSTSTLPNVAYSKMAYSNNLWVIGAGANLFSTSPDLTTWTNRTAANRTGSNINTVAYGNGVWLASSVVSGGVPGSNSLALSTDGTTWNFIGNNVKTLSLGSQGLGNINTIAYDGSILMAGGTFSSTTTSTAWGLRSLSSNSISWTTNTTSAVNTIAYGNGVWAAIGVGAATALVTTSTPGTFSFNTVRISTGVTPSTTGSGGLATNGLGLWAAGYTAGAIRYSTDNTITWNIATSNFGTSNINSISYGNGYFVAVGAGGAIRVSTDATTWNTATSNTTAILFSVANNGSRFAAAGASGVIRYSDSPYTTWTTATANNGTNQFNSVAFGNGQWVATGVTSTTSRIRLSTDAITWATQTVNGTLGSIKSPVYANSVWIAGNDAGDLIISTTGNNWAILGVNSGSSNVKDIKYLNGIWNAVGDGGLIRTSTDNGITWTTQTSAYSTTINEINFGNGLFTAVGVNGTLQTSTNATTWVARTSNFGTSNINSVIYGNQWLAAGDSATIRTSSDGITWATQNFYVDINGSITSLAYSGSYFLASAGSTLYTTSTPRTITIPAISSYLSNTSGMTPWIKK